MSADKNIDITQHEAKAVKIGGKFAGEYLQEIGVTDLRKLSKDQWQEFCVRLYAETCNDLARQAEEQVPF